MWEKLTLSWIQLESIVNACTDRWCGYEKVITKKVGIFKARREIEWKGNRERKSGDLLSSFQQKYFCKRWVHFSRILIPQLREFIGIIQKNDEPKVRISACVASKPGNGVGQTYYIQLFVHSCTKSMRSNFFYVPKLMI